MAGNDATEKVSAILTRMTTMIVLLQLMMNFAFSPSLNLHEKMLLMMIVTSVCFPMMCATKAIVKRAMRAIERGRGKNQSLLASGGKDGSGKERQKTMIDGEGR